MADLTEILRRAEMQQINLQTEVQLQQNLSFFKQRKPELHNKFCRHTPTDLGLLYNEEGFLNLVNYKLNNKPVYTKNPLEHAKEAIQHYKKKATSLKCTAAKAPILNPEEKNAHLVNANKMIDVLMTQRLEATRKLPPFVNFMIMLGVGMGYQLEQLLTATDIKHLCIIEPQDDIFYASMHTINWQPIFEHFNQEGYSLELIIGRKQDGYIAQLNAYLKRIGPFNTTTTFIFRHLTTNAIEESIRHYSTQTLEEQMNSAGFFDDEQVGLAHTISNTFNHIPILREHAVLNKSYLTKPAFIVANGPSLDNAVEFLQANHKKAIIFSCGTALGSLKKMGIKPDFHVEQERPRIMVEWIKSATNEEERKGVTILALNTVHPDILALFERKAMGMKANDVGTHYLAQFLKPQKQFINFGNCNPTVSNCALAYASALGFKDVYLFGLDLGFPSGEQHHSKFSKHYDVKKSAEDSLHILKPSSGKGLTVAGNFGGEIKTNGLFMRSRAEIEMAIKINKGMHCFNTSNGISISGAEPLHVQDIKIKTKEFNKKKYIDALYKKYFSADLLKKISVEDVKKVFDFAIISLSEIEKIARKPVMTTKEGMTILSELQNYISDMQKDQHLQYTASLLKGSISTFNIFLAQALLRTNNEETNLSLYNKCMAYFFDFIATAKEIVRDDLLKQDTSSHNLEAILNSSD